MEMATDYPEGAITLVVVVSDRTTAEIDELAIAKSSRIINTSINVSLESNDKQLLITIIIVN